MARDTYHASSDNFHPIKKSGKGYKVIAKSTGKPLSKKPLSKKKAQAQLRAVEVSKHGG